MPPAESADLAIREGLVRTAESPADRVDEAERKLRALLDEVNALDADIEALSEALDAFQRKHDLLLGAAYQQVDRAERLVRRLQALQDEIDRLLQALRSPPPAEAPEATGRRTRRKRLSARKSRKRAARGPKPKFFDEPDESESAPSAEVEREDEGRILKRLLRRLARVLHPDLARDEEERVRLNRLMSEVNAAYARGDRTALELLCEKVGAGEPVGELSDEERLAHLAKRIAALTEAARSLRLERDRLRATSTFKLHEEAGRRERLGHDYFEETAHELAKDEGEAIADAWARVIALHLAAAALSAERSTRMSKLTRQEGGRALRPFDPVLESSIVRMGAERLERRAATSEARALARELEAAMETAPWQVALTLLAYFAEVAERPPDSLKSPDAWRERYDALRADWPQAPALDRALTQLPAHLELGLRHQKGQVRFGVQLRSLELLAGVSIALERRSVADLARRVLLELGPREPCKGCGAEGSLVHLQRTWGLDELHAMVCPKCFHVQKRYWLYARTEGLEALLPHARRLGLVVEQVVKFAGASIGFQFLAAEREGLTADALLTRMRDCYFVPYRLDVPADALHLFYGQALLRGDEEVPPGVVKARLAKSAGMKERDALELLRSRIERRFRPDA